jgi:hypothetical protein
MNFNKLNCAELTLYLYDWNAMCPDDAVVGISKQAKHQLVLNCYNRNWNSITQRNIRRFSLSRNLADKLLFADLEYQQLKNKYSNKDYLYGFYEYLVKTDGECRIRWYIRNYTDTDIVNTSFNTESEYSALVVKRCDDVFNLYFE